MKRYFSIIFVAFLLAFVACNSNNEELDRDYTGNNKVVISAKSLGAITRSADTDPESTVAWLDVYVMDADKKIIYSERIDKSSAPVVGAGEFVLGKNRDEFTQDESYYVYMIANSTAPLATTSDVKAETWDDLKELTQTDRNLHLSGWGIDNNDVKSPEYFLMDGFAYVPANVNDVGPAAMEAFVINDGGDDNIELAGTLYRAAAKIVLNITQGDNVKFETVLDGATPLYSFYQLPISTLVVAPEADTRFVSEKQTTGEWGIDNKLFNFIQKDGKPMLTLLGYAYANDWNKEAANESSLLLSIPMMWDKDGDKSTGVDGKEASSPVNWYKVPLSKNNKFERNTCYVINININAIGAEEKNTPIELKDIEYVTLPWQEVQVEIGQTIAKYLTLNTDVVKIYDKNFDLDQLTFTSSSPIKSIKLKDTFSHNLTNSSLAALPLENEITDNEEVDSYEARYTGGDGLYAYYIDKFGQKIQLGTDPGFDLKDVDHTDWTKEVILEKENNLYNKDGVAYNEQYIRAEVPAGQERALNGNIHIYSPIYADATNTDLNWNSHFNTVRYLEFEVMNEQGITATFRVEQTPVTVIRNHEGFFSYRSDFCINGLRMHYNYDAFAKGFPILPTGQYRFADKRGPLHYLNPNEPFWAVAVFIPYHVHECNEDGQILSQVCGYIDKNNSTNGELVYGLMHSSRDTYRSHGPDAGVFHRDHYVDINGKDVPEESKISNGQGKYYQAIGLPYKDEVTGKYYRRHYVGQAQATFWSKFVMQSLKEDRKDTNGNVTKRKGLADITTQVPGDTYFLDGHFYWGGQGASSSLVNHRMYNVRVTATSNIYTVALPKMVDENGNPTDDRSQGYTMEGLVNSTVVSPSFTIASQLGSTSLPVNEGGYSRPGVAGFYEYAKHQCREYVETRYVDDDNSGGYTPGDRVYHYDDWRLPTKAEIDYIIKYQKVSRAMDKVMNAQYYFVASLVPDTYTEETVYSSEIKDYATGYAGHYMRCVRDALSEPEPVIYDANYNIVRGNPVKSN